MKIMAILPETIFLFSHTILQNSLVTFGVENAIALRLVREYEHQ